MAVSEEGLGPLERGSWMRRNVPERVMLRGAKQEGVQRKASSPARLPGRGPEEIGGDLNQKGRWVS